MANHTLNFTQKEVELDVSRVLVKGDIQDISNGSGIGYSYIDGWLNPNDERKSPIFRSLQIQAALDTINAVRGEKLFQTFRYFRELAKPALLDLKELCVVTEAGHAAREVAEMLCASIDNKPDDVKLKEALEAQDQVNRVVEGIRADIQRKRASSMTIEARR